MRTTTVVSLLAAGALSLPAIALGGLGPHSSDYSVTPSVTGQSNDVEVAVVRPRHQAHVYMYNTCLGKYTSSGRTFPDSATIPSHGDITIKNGHIAYQGKGQVSGSRGATTIAVTVNATVTPQRVSGSVKLPGRCGTIHFTAKLRSSTK